MNFRSERSDTGISLIEVLVVVAVLGILAGLTALSFVGRTDRADIAACEADRAIVERSVELWRAGSTPGTPTMDDLVTAGYLRAPSSLHTIEPAGTVTPLERCAEVDSGDDDGAGPAMRPAGLWRPIQGSSNMANTDDGSLSVNGSGLAINDEPMAADGTVSMTVDLEVDAEAGRTGSYGIWLRGLVENGSLRGGYTFQWDHGYGGGTFVLRHWDMVPNSANTGLYLRECSSPAATAPMDAAALGPGPHRVSVTLAGPRLIARVDGVVVMEVEDLDAAVAARAAACPHHRPPQGDHIGVRTWGTPRTVGTFSDVTYS